MLILSRKEEEAVLIGNNIRVKIISIDKGSVKLGFEAPNDMVILRDELKRAVIDANKQSTIEVELSELESLKQRFSK